MYKDLTNISTTCPAKPEKQVNMHAGYKLTHAMANFDGPLLHKTIPRL
jgi:hypothetical protein